MYVYSESCSCFYIIKIDVKDRRRRRKEEKERKRTNEARNIILHKYALLFILVQHLFRSFSLYVDNERPSSSPLSLCLLLSYLIFQYNYHSSNVIIIHPVQHTRIESVHTHTHIYRKPIMSRSVSRWICQISSTYGLGRQ